MYDAIVVGARCAGSSAALLLARKGCRVLLVDRAAFPSDTLSTHLIQLPGVARLKRWGLLAKVAASGCPPISKFTFDFGEFALTGMAPPMDGAAESYAPRRTALDKILVDAAVEAGVELREHVTVEEVITDRGRVTGIRASAGGGATHTEKARLVIGADGRHSFLARAVGAAEYDVRPPRLCWHYAYFSGVPQEGAYMWSAPGRAIGVVPTNDGLTNVVVGWPAAEFPAFRADVEGNFLKTLDRAPEIARRMRAGRRESRFFGTAGAPSFFRRPYGPGWALVGDAGYHRDPMTAQGITDAFRDAELLTEAVAAGLSGRRPLDTALADYEQARNAAVMPMYEFTYDMTALAPSPEEQQLFAALRGNQADTNRFLGAFAGTVPIPEFFSPQNTQRIVEQAQARSAISLSRPIPVLV